MGLPLTIVLAAVTQTYVAYWGTVLRTLLQRYRPQMSPGLGPVSDDASVVVSGGRSVKVKVVDLPVVCLSAVLILTQTPRNIETN
jgi:hypothetical protein